MQTVTLVSASQDDIEILTKGEVVQKRISQPAEV
jgi:hypothetical protein